jgi:acetyltransferase-like isoleucine patch superfamily enzyme
MLIPIKKYTYLAFKIFLTFLSIFNPKNRILWKEIGRGVKLSRFAHIRDSRLIALENNVRIEDHAKLFPMGGEITVGENTHILPYAMLLGVGGNIVIGAHCTVHPFSILYGSGGLKIGDSVRIAAHTIIVPSNHNFEDPEIPIRMQGIRTEGITIKDDVWIGAGVRILDGVTIGRGSVIGAGAVVTKSVPDYAIVTGVPARVAGWRNKRQI